MDEFWLYLAIGTIAFDGVFMLAAAVAHASAASLARQLKAACKAQPEDVKKAGPRLQKVWKEYSDTFIVLHDERRVTRHKAEKFFTLQNLVSRAMPLVWRLAAPGLPLAIAVAGMLAGLSHGALEFESASHDAMLASIKRFFGAAGMSFLFFLAGGVLSGLFRLGKGLMLSRLERNLDRLTDVLDETFLLSREEDRRMALDEYLTGVMALSEQTDRLIRENREQQSTLHRDLLSRFQSYGDSLGSLSESLTAGMARQTEQFTLAGRELISEMHNGLERIASMQADSWAEQRAAMQAYGQDLASEAVDLLREETVHAVRQAGDTLAGSVASQMGTLGGAVDQAAGQLTRASEDLSTLQGEFALALDKASERIDRQTRQGLEDLQAGILGASNSLRQAVDQATESIREGMDRNRAYLGGVLEVLGQTTDRMQETASSMATVGERFQQGLDQAGEAERIFVEGLSRQAESLDQVVASLEPVTQLPKRLDEVVGRSLASVRDTELAAVERIMTEAEAAERNMAAMVEALNEHLEKRDVMGRQALEDVAAKGQAMVEALQSLLAGHHESLAGDLKHLHQETAKELVQVLREHGASHSQAHDAMQSSMEHVGEVVSEAGQELARYRRELAQDIAQDMEEEREAMAGHAADMAREMRSLAAAVQERLAQVTDQVSRSLEGYRAEQGRNMESLAVRLEELDRTEDLERLDTAFARSHETLMEQLAQLAETNRDKASEEDAAEHLDEMLASLREFFAEQMQQALSAVSATSENVRRELESTSVDIGLMRTALQDGRMRELTAQERNEATQRMLRKLAEQMGGNGNGNGNGNHDLEHSMRAVQSLSDSLAQGLSELESFRSVLGGNGTSGHKADKVATATADNIRLLGQEIGALFRGMIDGLRAMQELARDMGGEEDGDEGPAAERIGACLARVSQAAQGLAGAVGALEQGGK